MNLGDLRAAVEKAERERPAAQLPPNDAALREDLTLAIAQERVSQREAAREELAAILDVMHRRRWRADPAAWVAERLRETIWSAQARILRSIRDHRKTAARTCHEIGKSFIAARAAGWWLDIHKPGEAAVITTAPTHRQVRAVLWKEIGRVAAKLQIGRAMQTEWRMDVMQDNGETTDELVAFGFKPADWSPESFQGIHARYILVIPDEACGIPRSLWPALISLGANERSRFLATGNPDIVDSAFFDICKAGSDWNVIGVGAFDTPNFTDEVVPDRLREELIGHTYVEENRKEWAPRWNWVDREGRPLPLDRFREGVRCVPPEGADPRDTNPYWQSKVLGVFPKSDAADGLIPSIWIREAMDRELPPGEPNELGVDVGAGGDANCIAHRQGPVIRIVLEDHNPDTMQTLGNTMQALEETGATLAKIDDIGVGKGAKDQARQQASDPMLPEGTRKRAAMIVGVSVGNAARDPEHFINARAENYWGLRERFEHGEVDLDPEDTRTAAELTQLRYKRNSRGQIVIESKDEMKKRGVPSPNRAEAVMLATCVPPEVSQGTGGLVW
jgi:hypothetical protein